jgi:hypothetical protein
VTTLTSSPNDTLTEVPKRESEDALDSFAEATTRPVGEIEAFAERLKGLAQDAEWRVEGVGADLRIVLEPGRGIPPHSARIWWPSCETTPGLFVSVVELDEQWSIVSRQAIRVLIQRVASAVQIVGVSQAAVLRGDGGCVVGFVCDVPVEVNREALDEALIALTSALMWTKREAMVLQDPAIARLYLLSQGNGSFSEMSDC